MASSRKSTSIENVQVIAETVLGRNLAPGQRVLVAFSGGLDSSVLLDVLASYRKRAGINLSALHFHHGISPNADAWADHCQGVCAGLDIPLQIQHLKIPSGSGEGMEASARRLRYEWLERNEAKWVALGHHADDQAETLLLNLFRGAGVLGMSGMRAVEGRYLRPLLALNRAQLLAYAESRGLRWCEDESNQSRSFTRNYIRHDVLPLLAERFPSLPKKLTNSAEHFATTQRLLTELAEIDAANAPIALPFPLAPFKQLGRDRAANLLRCLLTTEHLQCPPTARLREFVRQLLEAGPDRHPELRLGRQTVSLKGGHLVLGRSAETC